MRETSTRQLSIYCSCSRKRRKTGRPTTYTVIMLSAAAVARYSSALMQHRSVSTRRPTSGALHLATDSRRLRFEGQSPATDLFSEFSFYIRAKSLESQDMISASAALAAVNTATLERAYGSTTGERQDGQRGSTKLSGSSRYQRRYYATSSDTTPDTKTDSTSNHASVKPRLQGSYFGPSLDLTDDEALLFQLLAEVREKMGLATTLRVAGGWVRDKLLATNEYQSYHKVFEVGSGDQRLTSKFRRHFNAAKMPGLGFTGSAGKPVDIDIALDDMLGREFADYVNDYLTSKGEDTVSVGVVLKNPEKSKHLETATMKVGSFWIDFVNLRAEEYTQDSRIPDLMRIGSPSEDAFRRDLTINALFYNVNTGQVEDFTGRGISDLQKGVVATPLPPLTTLLDDPLRVLRSIRFAARLRFIMDQELVDAARDGRVRRALAQKVSRERIGAELDLMLRSPDPVGAMRLLLNLNLVGTVLPISHYLPKAMEIEPIFQLGLRLLSTSHDHLADCRWSPPMWCQDLKQTYGDDELPLKDDDQKRRLLWYASFLKPLHDVARQRTRQRTSVRACKKAGQSALVKLLVEDIKRPIREAEAIEQIMETADEFTRIIESGLYVTSIMILLGDIQVSRQTVNGDTESKLICSMNGRPIDSTSEDDPVWQHAMEFRQLCAPIIKRIGSNWRAALLLALSEQLAAVDVEGLEYTIEGDMVSEIQLEQRQGVIEKYDAFATALQEVGLIGIQNEKPLLCGDAIKRILTRIPQGPAFRTVMDEQMQWMTGHPGSHAKALEEHLKVCFPDFV